ncbi:MAG TPA: HAD family phosphatase [Candidatus Saccharimonadales bacterium]|nr:HAD family phosphatase [Candidatus Saccharimonadales bacterium]
MLSIVDVKGVIFDVDETLLDTGVSGPGGHVNALHERARLQAVHEAGKRHAIPELMAVTPEENLRGFLDAPTHSLEGAVWHIMYMCGLVATDEIERTNPLLHEMVTRKDELYEKLLRTEGKPLPGAVAFIAWLAEKGLAEHMAIASTAIRRDIDIFLEFSNLTPYFPTARVISKGDVTHVKPHPEAFEKAFQTLGLPDNTRSQVLAFEDNPRGVVSAKGAGLFTCAITTVSSRQELAGAAVPPDLIADSFDEFRQLLSANT